MILGIYFNRERATYMDYVEPPFVDDPVAVFVPRGSGLRVEGAGSLEGHKGVTGAGESFGTEFDTVIASRLEVARVPETAAGFEAILGGLADYMIVGLHPGRAEAVRLGIADRLAVAAGDLVSQPMYVAVSKRSPCRAAVMGLSERIAAAVQDGTVAGLVEMAREDWENMVSGRAK